MKLNVLKQLITYLLTLLFTYTSMLKIIDYQDFVIKLLKSSILPTEFVGFISYFIPTIEILTVILLLFKTIWGLYASFILMCAFTFYLVLLNSYSNYSGCSCGGILNNLSFKSHLVFNIFFIVLSVLGIFLYSSENKATKK
ncbi:MauE/DoxX family redox-associated membrane protein [Parafilimonas sp.]|uniref:MauE/DoxX family redox-associated membrane protein n=1 Tax=Parafilimonas sp. TaxID=1969739 RepID=UPI003F7ED355